MRIVIHGVSNAPGPIVLENVDAFFLATRVGNTAPLMCNGTGPELVRLAGLVLRDVRQSFGEGAFAVAIEMARLEVKGHDISGDVLRGGV